MCILFPAFLLLQDFVNGLLRRFFCVIVEEIGRIAPGHFPMLRIIYSKIKSHFPIVSANCYVVTFIFHCFVLLLSVSPTVLPPPAVSAFFPEDRTKPR